ncbi:hypothetical protein ACIA5G_38000 [Amycolatopsis sp. NPDC051758]|uniref:hypothetical protein n=1 Tax=Amycolatopsis sp. NPDC051758 TaxID=3363935 RepID=UPI0037A6C656
MDVRPALWAVVAGAALTLGMFWLLESVGPVEREEATVEATDPKQWPVSDEPGARESETKHLVLRTASGERFEAWGKDRHLSLSRGTWLQVEISVVGREVQAIEVYGRRTTVDSGGLGAFVAGLVGFGMLMTAGAAAVETDRPALAGLSVLAGLAAGVAPVLLLF